jgi:excisionase family DNA binding protein
VLCIPCDKEGSAMATGQTPAPKKATPKKSTGTGNMLVPLMTVDEVYPLLRISRRTLTRLVSEGKVPSVHVGHRRMFRRDDIAEILSQRG